MTSHTKKRLRRIKKKKRQTFKNKRTNKSRTSLKKIGGSLFKNLRCKPSINKLSYSCFTKEQIVELKNIWNKQHRDEQVSETDPEKIWHQLKEKNKDCNMESCWIKKLIISHEIRRKFLSSFAPKAPDEWKKQPNTWLTNIDISNVMNQYESTYPCFEFIGPSPIDFDVKEQDICVWEELCKFNLQKYVDKGKFKIGIIFNTDVHDGAGEHWISLFINVPKSAIFFFDSVGSPIPPQIKKFVDNVIDQGKKMNKVINFNFDQNHPIEHQYKNTECGVYSLFFIVHMLEDKINGGYLKTHILKDNYIEQYRKVFFNEKL